MLKIFLLLIIGSNLFADNQIISLFSKWDKNLHVPLTQEQLTKAKSPLWETSKSAIKYRRSIEAAWKTATEPNFARRYFVPKSIGCGTGCEMIFVIDWISGEIFTPPQHHSFKVTKSSRLLILKPYDTCSVYGSPILYEFTEKNKFKEIPHKVCN